MLLQINGEQREVLDVNNVADLMSHLAVREDRVAIEVNFEIIRKENRATFLLHEHDKIEIVSFLGGG